MIQNNSQNNNNQNNQNVFGSLFSGLQSAQQVLSGEKKFKDTGVGSVVQAIQNAPKIEKPKSGVQKFSLGLAEKYSQPKSKPAQLLSKSLSFSPRKQELFNLGRSVANYMSPSQLSDDPELRKVQQGVQRFVYNEVIRALPRATARFTLDGLRALGVTDETELRGYDPFSSAVLTSIFGAPNDTGYGYEHLQSPLGTVTGFGREFLGQEARLVPAFLVGSIFNGLDMVPGVGGGARKLSARQSAKLVSNLNEKALLEYAKEIASTTNRTRISQIIDDIVVNIPSKRREQLVRQLVSESDSTKLYADLLVNFNKTNRLTKASEITNISPLIKRNIEAVHKGLAPKVEKLRKTLTNSEVIESSKYVQVFDSLEPLTRKQIKKNMTRYVKTVEDINDTFAKSLTKGMSEKDKVKIIDNAYAYVSNMSNHARVMQFNAVGRLGNDNLKYIHQMLKSVEDAEEMIRRLKQIDITDTRQLKSLHADFVKPRMVDYIDEFRYINMLSSPETQLINATGNFLQAFVTEPLLTRLPNSLIDSFASLLTGKSRQAYLKEVPIYYRSLISNMPKLGSFLRRGLSGNLVSGRPDMRITEAFRPSKTGFGKTIQGLYYSVPRFMESMDQFAQLSLREAEVNSRLFRFSKNISKKGGLMDESFVEARRLFAQGFDVDAVGQRLLNTPFYKEIYDPSAKAAQKLIFRQAFDTRLHNNETGQGYFFTYLDRVGSYMTKIQKDIPGVSLFVPFVRTPVQIFKQGVEYSPLGFATMLGARNKQEQFVKALMGSVITTSLAFSLDETKIQGAFPKDKRERELMEESGIRPWSIKIGDNWYSINRLGPLAYPVALSIGIRKGLDDPRYRDEDVAQRLAHVGSNTMSFFVSQNYLRGIENIFSLLSGGASNSTLALNAAGVANQFVPMSGLLNWIRKIEDDVVRDVKSDKFGHELLNRVMNRIPGLSRELPAKRSGLTGRPIRNRANVINAFTPVDITRGDKNAERVFRLELEGQRVRTQRRGRIDQEQALAESVFEKMILQDDVGFMREYLMIKQINPDLARRIERLRLSSQRTTEDDIILSLPVTDGSRAVFIKGQILDRLPNDETRLMKIKELQNKKVISESVLKQLILLYSQQ